MNRTISVSVRGVLMAAVTLLGLLCAYLLGGVGDGPGTPASAADPQGRERTVTMAGTGTVTVVPDEVSFTVTVGVLRDDLSAALDEGNATMRTVLTALEGHGVGTGQVQTTGLSMRPVHDYHPEGPPTLRGYRVTQNARVTVPELSRAGKAITAAIEAGGNDARVNNISLGVSDLDSALGKARDDAVEKATTKAEQYAEATGQALGDVVSLHEARPDTPVVEEYARDALADLSALKATPLRAGEDEREVTVEIVWQLG